MKNKFTVSLIIGIFLISLASAEIFDFLSFNSKEVNITKKMNFQVIDLIQNESLGNIIFTYNKLDLNGNIDKEIIDKQSINLLKYSDCLDNNNQFYCNDRYFILPYKAKQNKIMEQQKAKLTTKKDIVLDLNSILESLRSLK